MVLPELLLLLEELELLLLVDVLVLLAGALLEDDELELEEELLKTFLRSPPVYDLRSEPELLLFEDEFPNTLTLPGEI